MIPPRTPSGRGWTVPADPPTPCAPDENERAKGSQLRVRPRRARGLRTRPRPGVAPVRKLERAPARRALRPPSRGRTASQPPHPQQREREAGDRRIRAEVFLGPSDVEITAERHQQARPTRLPERDSESPAHAPVDGPGVRRDPGAGLVEQPDPAVRHPPPTRPRNVAGNAGSRREVSLPAQQRRQSPAIARGGVPGLRRWFGCDGERGRECGGKEHHRISLSDRFTPQGLDAEPTQVPSR